MSAALFTLPFPVAFTSRGVGAPGAKAYFYQTSTLTPLPVYTTSALTTEGPNPATADGAGRFDAIYLDNTKTYRVIINDKTGAQLCDVDPYIPGQAPDAASLQPYADAAAASASAASTSATNASTSATAASASATNAATSATSASGSATVAQAAATGAEAAQAGIIAELSGTSLASAVIPVATKDLLAALDPTVGMPAVLTDKEAGGEHDFITPNVLQVTAFQADIAADIGRGLYIAPAASTGYATDGSQGYWKRRGFDGFKRPEWFDGFVGDGVSSDQVAFTNMKSLADHLGYMRVRLTPRTYMVGGQAGDGTYYLNSVNAIVSTTTLIVEGNGATLKTNPGLKYGTFDPVTGDPLATYSTAAANTARGPTTIYASGCDLAWISNVILDGNPTSFIVGGGTNSGTLEAHHYGIQLVQCKVAGVVNFKVTGFLQDCLVIGNSTAAETDTATPHFIANGVLDGGGRCCLSVLGGVNRVIDDVQMVNPGAALVWPNGSHGTSPKVPCDIEAEGTIRQVVFRRCSFEQGVYGANSLTCGSSNTKGVLFEDCLFVGKHLPNSPRMTFRRCRFYGPFVQLYTNTLPEEAMVFNECFLTDATFNDTPLQTGGGNLFFGTSGNGVRFKDTVIDVSRHRIQAGNGIGTGRNIWTFRFGTETFPGSTAAVTLGSGYWDGLKIVEAIAANPPAGPYIVTWTAGGATLRDCEIVTPLNLLTWASPSGFSGQFNSITGRRGIDTQGNASVTMDVTISKEVQNFNTALTANRTVTLPAPVSGLTRRFRIARSASATGSFNLTVNTSSAVALRALTAASTFVDVLSDNGAEYVVVGSGAI
jgi:hypothetical protein